MKGLQRELEELERTDSAVGAAAKKYAEAVARVLRKSGRKERQTKMMHRLKTDREPFEAVLRGDKTFEFRLNDREFSPGDTVILDCWNDETDHVVNVDPITAEIGFVLFGPNYGVPEDYCVISLLNPRTASGPCRTSATGGGDRG